jgi:hypothetical protein
VREHEPTQQQGNGGGRSVAAAGSWLGLISPVTNPPQHSLIKQQAHLPSFLAPPPVFPRRVSKQPSCPFFLVSDLASNRARLPPPVCTAVQGEGLLCTPSHPALLRHLIIIPRHVKSAILAFEKNIIENAILKYKSNYLPN